MIDYRNSEIGGSLKIDWVKIPKGSAYLGFSQKDIAQIKDYAYGLVKFDTWDPEDKLIFNEYINYFKNVWVNGRDSIDKVSEETSKKVRKMRYQIQGLNDLIAIERGLLDKSVLFKIKTIETFYIARFPITSVQFNYFYDREKDRANFDKNRKNRSKESQNLPEAMSWDEVSYLCERLNIRLPTSDEWEYAARGPDGHLYPWGNTWSLQKANYQRSASREHRPVHLKHYANTPVDAFPEGASTFEVWDMIGNMSEWVDGLPGTKSPSAEERHVPAWFWFMPAHNFSPTILPGYTGFRPAKDHWDQQVWQGHSFDQ